MSLCLTDGDITLNLITWPQKVSGDDFHMEMYLRSLQEVWINSQKKRATARGPEDPRFTVWQKVCGNLIN